MGLLFSFLHGASADFALQERLLYPAISTPGGSKVRLDEALSFVQLDGLVLILRSLLPSLGSRLLDRDSLFL
jgi:hypothetical protein